MLYAQQPYTIYAKAEFLNPTGSIKDRIAKYIVEEAEASGELRPGMTIVEATSGNTGISFAQIAAVKGYKMIVFMPEHMSLERIRLISCFGAEIILTPVKDSFLGAVAKAEELAKTRSDIFLPRQFSNPNNVRCHQLTTGKEILDQIDRMAAFVAGVGTGGTLIGVGEAVKPIFPDCLMVAVEPEESAVLSGSKTLKSHIIQGIGDGFIPEIVDMKKIDRIEKVSGVAAISMTKELACKYGLMVGISSGANVLAALRIAQMLGPDKNVVTVLPDRAERYFSILG